MSEWQPIETAPKDGTEFLALTDSNRVRVVKYRGDKFSCAINWRTSLDRRRFTHWMPLPPPQPASGRLIRASASLAVCAEDVIQHETAVKWCKERARAEQAEAQLAAAREALAEITAYFKDDADQLHWMPKARAALQRTAPDTEKDTPDHG